jgi:hypothetical protein
VYDKFEVITASDLVHKCFPDGVEPRLIPDHSVLRYVFSPGWVMQYKLDSEVMVTEQFRKFDVSDVPMYL